MRCKERWRPAVSRSWGARQASVRSVRAVQTTRCWRGRSRIAGRSSSTRHRRGFRRLTASRLPTRISCSGCPASAAAGVGTHIERTLLRAGDAERRLGAARSDELWLRGLHRRHACRDDHATRRQDDARDSRLRRRDVGRRRSGHRYSVPARGDLRPAFPVSAHPDDASFLRRSPRSDRCASIASICRVPPSR